MLLICFLRLIKEIDSFIHSKEGHTFLKLLFSKDERIDAIDGYHGRISVHAFRVSLETLFLYCPYSLKLSAVTDIRAWQKKNDDGRATDQRLLNDCLTELEANQAKLRE